MYSFLYLRALNSATAVDGDQVAEAVEVPMMVLLRTQNCHKVLEEGMEAWGPCIHHDEILGRNEAVENLQGTVVRTVLDIVAVVGHHHRAVGSTVLKHPKATPVLLADRSVELVDRSGGRGSEKRLGLPYAHHRGLDVAGRHSGCNDAAAAPETDFSSYFRPYHSPLL